jgi:diaminohydroxyphosphoribosylaminopyrimidine deaminase/5-amino-6-(5-phosphoribosylamino)uracil reductase
MDRALFLAARGRGRTSPNPLVGAVVVAGDGVIVGQGFHRRAGDRTPKCLLEESGPRARARRFYCTLEPCCHVGRTTVCADCRVGFLCLVAAIEDPNPLVTGKASNICGAWCEVDVGSVHPCARAQSTVPHDDARAPAARHLEGGDEP